MLIFFWMHNSNAINWARMASKIRITKECFEGIIYIIEIYTITQQILQTTN